MSEQKLKVDEIVGVDSNTAPLSVFPRPELPFGVYSRTQAITVASNKAIDELIHINRSMITNPKTDQIVNGRFFIRNGSTIVEFKSYEDLLKNFSPMAVKLVLYFGAVIEENFKKIDQLDNDIDIVFKLKDLGNLCGVSDLKTLKASVLPALDLLVDAVLCWESRNISYQHHFLSGVAYVKNKGLVICKLNAMFAKAIVEHGYRYRLPILFFRIDTNKYRYALFIILYLMWQKKMNRWKPNEDIIGFRKLLEFLSIDLDHTRAYKRKIEQITNNLDALSDLFSYDLQLDGKTFLPDELFGGIVTKEIILRLKLIIHWKDDPYIGDHGEILCPPRRSAGQKLPKSRKAREK